MKKLIIFLGSIIVFLLGSSCANKVNFECYSKVKNTLYLDTQNKFYIKSEHPQRLKVDITNATIKQENDTTYTIITDSKEYSRMKISDGKNSKHVTFKKRNIPSPRLVFKAEVYYKNKTMKVDVAKGITSFSSVIGDYGYDLLFVSSSLGIMRIDTSNRVSYEKIGVNRNRRIYSLRRAQVGDIYIFYNIKIEVSKGVFVDGEDLVLKIIE